MPSGSTRSRAESPVFRRSLSVLSRLRRMNNLSTAACLPWQLVPGPLGVPDGLVGEVGDAALEGLGAGEAQGLPVAGLAEQALAGPERDWEDLQPQLVDPEAFVTGRVLDDSVERDVLAHDDSTWRGRK